ncbi:hypothetical protein PENARI_c017G12523 [Penicillium arizonense]|uniref:Uncharacterized protein n=1 Tax=Penicillium arizonense TaxID=1835702 RepID=A0A1F5LB53_PENAI|nr:hypothetical protein PENARI_c017G12523 [Penicillium arizonense]OGE50296.1 hypothetical protein PENARI_c017G12523 [Penicillium arizonense]
MPPGSSIIFPTRPFSSGDCFSRVDCRQSFVTVCGPPKYSELRINLSQAFNGIGTVIAPVLGSYVFFKFGDDSAMDNVQWIYLAIAIFVFLLALLIYFPLFQKSLMLVYMAIQVQETHTHADEKPFAKQYKLFHASFAQFCYTGAQVAIASMFINYATEMRSNTDESLGAKFFATGSIPGE